MAARNHSSGYFSSENANYGEQDGDISKTVASGVPATSVEDCVTLTEERLATSHEHGGTMVCAGYSSEVPSVVPGESFVAGQQQVSGDSSCLDRMHLDWDLVS